MLRTVEAVVDDSGQIKLLEALPLRARQRVLVTVLENDTVLEDEAVSETALLSERTLAEDWNRDEEDEAWNHLQPDR